MREIKFRAWDEYRKAMGEVTFMNDVGSDTWEVDYLGTPGEPKTGLIIEQFTGIKDKNGREIYEGDIVEWQWLTGTVRGVVEWDAKRAQFCAGDRKENLLAHTVVIGNIHENPELLK